MSHTDGGERKIYSTSGRLGNRDFVDLGAVSKGGKLLACGVQPHCPISGSIAWPTFVGNTLLGAAPFSTDDASGLRRQEYNHALPTTSARFIRTFRSHSLFRTLSMVMWKPAACRTQASPLRYRRSRKFRR